MCEGGVIRPEEETVVFVTGNGYKTIEALEGHLEPSFRVPPDLDAFLEALGA
jgi:threonine synthase